MTLRQLKKVVAFYGLRRIISFFTRTNDDRKKMNAPLVPTPNTINLVCALPTYLRYTLILYLLTPSLPRRLFRFLHQNPVCIFLLTLTSGKDYKIWSYSLCSFLKPPLISFLLGPNVLISMPLHSLSQHQKLLVTFQCLPHRKVITQSIRLHA